MFFVCETALPLVIQRYFVAFDFSDSEDFADRTDSTSMLSCNIECSKRDPTDLLEDTEVICMPFFSLSSIRMTAPMILFLYAFASPISFFPISLSNSRTYSTISSSSFFSVLYSSFNSTKVFFKTTVSYAFSSFAKIFFISFSKSVAFLQNKLCFSFNLSYSSILLVETIQSSGPFVWEFYSNSQIL